MRECLASTHKALVLYPALYKTDMVVNTCHPASQEFGSKIDRSSSLSL